VTYAQRVLGDIGEIRRTIGQRASLVGHIRLGVVETIAFTQLPELLRRLAHHLPELTVDVDVGVTPELIRRVRTRELDVACVVAPVLEPELASEPFWEVQMSWIAPGAQWTDKPLSVAALAAQTIVLQTGSRHIPVIEGWFRTRGIRARHMIMCNSLAAAVKMTAAGLGLSLVPIECAREELDGGAVCQVPVQVELPTNSFVTLYPIGQSEPALDAVIDVMRELSRDLLTPRAVRKRAGRQAANVS
jgi:DNA-binding transcriptional LysR family regulator